MKPLYKKLALGLTTLALGAGTIDASVLTANEIEKVLAGELPTYYGDKIPMEDWTKLYEDSAWDMGVDMDEVYRRILNGETVNLAQEMRKKAKEQGLEVKHLQK